MRRAVVVDKEAMSLGYREMAELNLNIANEWSETEEQGWSVVYEMGTKKTGDSAE